jgi:NAD(P)-dependent dehydrogenase (short-subunit alcohol dehydrogenase family)
MLIFKNKITFISGATGNIGKKLCEKFAREGSDLIITDKNRKSLETIKKKLNKRFNIKVNYVESDLTDYESRVTMLKFIKKNFKKIDFIINNAGFTGSQRNKLDWNGNIDEQKIELWNKAIEVNLSSIFHISKELKILQKKNNNSVIINLGSIYSVLGPDLALYKSTNLGSPAAYFASKGGLLQLTRWLASSLAPIRVNMVSPGGIYNNQPNKFVKKYVKKLLIKRMCKVDDVVYLVQFLCSNQSSYITGQNILVDGGISCI